MKSKKLSRAAAAVLATAMTATLAPAVYAADGDSAATGTVVYSFDFEDGDVSAFTNRGGDDTTVLSASDDASVSGSKSLLASGRSKDWNGPAFRLDDKLEPYTEYYISAKVKGRYYTNATFSFQYTDSDGQVHYSNLVQNLNSGDWVSLDNVKVSFTDEMTDVFVYFEGGQDDIFIDDFVVTELAAASIEQDIPSLSAVFANDFIVGTAITPSDLSSKGTMALIEKHLGKSITVGNEMKPESVLNQAACQAYFEETGDDTVPQISFSAAKPVLNYCRDNNIPVRIHTLVWHSQTPGWFFKEGYSDEGEWVDEATMIKRMENYIKAYFETLIELYPTIDFYACDVVNEAWLEDGKPRQPGYYGENGTYDKSGWVKVFGDNSFIEYAFTFARQYAPEGCKLYYNDYNEYMDGKMNAIIEMAKDLKAKGVIDGIGMQSHLDARQSLDAAFPSVNAYNKALDKYAELGLDIQITELDATTPENPTDADFEVQAQYYKGIWDSIYAHKDNISAVILWGITDPASWRAKQYPLLFDGDYKAKPAFYAIIEGHDVPDVTPTQPTTEKPTTTPTSDGSNPTEKMLGDANCDGVVSIADSTAILQHLGNKDKYELSAQGVVNADCYDPGSGITAADALSIQKLDAKVITSLPEKAE